MSDKVKCPKCTYEFIPNLNKMPILLDDQISSNDSKKQLLISVGHKWKDSGAVSTLGGVTLKEVDANWRQTLPCYNYLQQNMPPDWEVKLLIPRGVENTEDFKLIKDFNLYKYSKKEGTLSISDRIVAANNLKSFLVELHNNIASTESVDGSEVIIFCSKNSDNSMSESCKLATSVMNELASFRKRRDPDVKEIFNREKNDYIVISERRPAILVKTNKPSIIVESGFISNPGYRNSVLSDSNFNQKIGKAIGAGVVHYIKNFK